jgi:hypothetical protein
MNFAESDIARFFDEVAHIHELSATRRELATVAAITVIREHRGSASGETLCANLVRHPELHFFVTRVRAEYAPLNAIMPQIARLASRAGDRSDERLEYIRKIASWTESSELDLGLLLSEAQSFIEQRC